MDRPWPPPKKPPPRAGVKEYRHLRECFVDEMNLHEPDVCCLCGRDTSVCVGRSCRNYIGGKIWEDDPSVPF